MLRPARLAAAAPATQQQRRRRLAVVAATTPTTTSSTTTTSASYTCRRCLRRFAAADNVPDACRRHPALYSGGEVAKAIGFVRASADAGDQLGAVVGRTGLMRFWDCCGNEDEGAPGCEAGFHQTFDDALNDAQGWTAR
jgi:hypothetical protein